jgi:hypothetical protein
MKDNGIEIFLTGLATGIIFLVAVLIFTDATPLAERKKWEIEAFKRGYGEMVVKDDKLEFQWKEQPK